MMDVTYNSTFEICEKCQGRGEVFHSWREEWIDHDIDGRPFRDGADREEWAPCDTCDATGRVKITFRCDQNGNPI